MSEPRYALDDFNSIPGEDLASPNGKAERDSWLPVNLADLPAEPPVRPTLGFGLVYPGRRHVFSGPQESAKTLAAYAIGLDTIRHTGTPVALIDFEMGKYAARNRLQELGATTADFANLHYIAPEQPATLERISLVIALDPSIVIIDAAAGAYDLQGLDDNKRSDVEKFTHLYVRGFWQAGIATIVLDHVVKNTETRGKYAIGSERKTGGVDVHLGFDTILPIKRGSTGLYKIVTHKDRDGFLQRGTLAELHLTSDPSTHRVSWEFKQAEHVEPGEVWMPTKAMQKISGLLEAKTEPVSRNSILIEIGGRQDVGRKAIDHLVRLGYATETDGPRNAKLLQHTRSFTVLEWENQHPHNDLIPPNPDLIPDGVIPPNPTSSPPYRGTTVDGDDVDDQKELDLIPPENEPVPLPEIDYSQDLDDDPEFQTVPADSRASDDLPF